MTCFEKYTKEHNGKTPNINYMCPHISGNIEIDEPDYCPDDNGYAVCHACWQREVPTEPTSIEDNVNHPTHYTNGSIECIDAMVAAYGKENVATYCIINSFKYIWRSEHKNGIEDIKKAIWYLNKHVELKEGMYEEAV